MRWSYPELVELDRALAQRCDVVLCDETFLVREQPTRAVHWRYRDREFRATYLALGWARPLSPLGYLRWRRDQSFGALPTHPDFAWRWRDMAASRQEISPAGRCARWRGRRRCARAPRRYLN